MANRLGLYTFTYGRNTPLDMIKFTKNTLKKVEELYKAIGFKVRYGQGNFHAGHCILETQNIVVVNKMFDPEAKIHCLLDILTSLEVDEAVFDENMVKFYEKMMQERARLKGAELKAAES